MGNIHLTPEDLQKCEFVKNFLEKNFARHYTNNELARKVSTNQNKLKEGFKTITHHTIYEFVTMLRIERAKELLETTYVPIETIAYQVGLDQSNLIRQFKKLAGKTPKEWRNERRNGYAS